jgi:hypothetical protein
MKGPQYTVEIDRLVLTGLDLTPAQAEQVRSRLAGELQTLLAGRRGGGDTAAIDLERVNLPALSPGEVQDHGRLASALARHIAGALPGTGGSAPRR